LLGRGFVVAASILEGDYLDKYKFIEPVRSVSINDFLIGRNKDNFGV
jgi:hypothetical protein